MKDSFRYVKRGEVFLKLCPFCGSEPATLGTFMDGQAGLRCCGCGCSVRAKTNEDAAKQWNRRTILEFNLGDNL